MYVCMYSVDGGWLYTNHTVVVDPGIAEVVRTPFLSILKGQRRNALYELIAF